MFNQSIVDSLTKPELLVYLSNRAKMSSGKVVEFDGYELNRLLILSGKEAHYSDGTKYELHKGPFLDLLNNNGLDALRKTSKLPGAEEGVNWGIVKFVINIGIGLGIVLGAIIVIVIALSI